MNYFNKLHDIRWKKKRKKILKRDNFKCTVCESTKELEVHHTFYYSDRPNPWEYPDKSLLTLCDECHLKYHIVCEVKIKHKKQKKQKKTTE